MSDHNIFRDLPSRQIRTRQRATTVALVSRLPTDPLEQQSRSRKPLLKQTTGFINLDIRLPHRKVRTRAGINFPQLKKQESSFYNHTISPIPQKTISASSMEPSPLRLNKSVHIRTQVNNSKNPFSNNHQSARTSEIDQVIMVRFSSLSKRIIIPPKSINNKLFTVAYDAFDHKRLMEKLDNDEQLDRRFLTNFNKQNTNFLQDNVSICLETDRDHVDLCKAVPTQIQVMVSIDCPPTQQRTPMDYIIIIDPSMGQQQIQATTNAIEQLIQSTTVADRIALIVPVGGQIAKTPLLRCTQPNKELLSSFLHRSANSSLSSIECSLLNAAWILTEKQHKNFLSSVLWFTHRQASAHTIQQFKEILCDKEIDPFQLHIFHFPKDDDEQGGGGEEEEPTYINYLQNLSNQIHGTYKFIQSESDLLFAVKASINRISSTIGFRASVSVSSEDLRVAIISEGFRRDSYETDCEEYSLQSRRQSQSNQKMQTTRIGFIHAGTRQNYSLKFTCLHDEDQLDKGISEVPLIRSTLLFYDTVTENHTKPSTYIYKEITKTIRIRRNRMKTTMIHTLSMPVIVAAIQREIADRIKQFLHDLELQKEQPNLKDILDRIKNSISALNELGHSELAYFIGILAELLSESIYKPTFSKAQRSAASRVKFRIDDMIQLLSY